jgi:hypothetical protein
MTPPVGLIGARECGTAIAARLREEHGPAVAGYDARFVEPGISADTEDLYNAGVPNAARTAGTKSAVPREARS